MYYLLGAAANVCARGLNSYLLKIPADKAAVFNGVDLAAQVVSYFVLSRILHQYYVLGSPEGRKERGLEATIASLAGSTLVGLVAGVFAARRMQVNPWAASMTSSLSGVIGVCVVILLKEYQIL
jgi:hypothetical protein